MARSKYGNSTSYIGRIGNVVSYEWRGKVCQRSLPSHYNDARSEAQLSQRSMFKLVVGFAARARRSIPARVLAKRLQTALAWMTSHPMPSQASCT